MSCAQQTPFVLTEPEASESPVLVEVPHAGLFVPPHFLTQITAPAHAIARDADLFVDELFHDAPLEGATLLASRVSRYVTDLNRSEADVDADSVQGAGREPRAARGIVWRISGEGAPVLAHPLTPAQLDERLAEVYRPYHAKLREVLERKHAKFGFAILLAAHSMPSTSPGERDAGRADVVPGSRGRTSADARVIDAVDAHAKSASLSVRHDDPYRGGYSTLHYGRPSLGFHAVQVELARRLYMDEATLRKNGGFTNLRAWARTLVSKLGALTPPR